MEEYLKLLYKVVVAFVIGTYSLYLIFILVNSGHLQDCKVRSTPASL